MLKHTRRPVPSTEAPRPRVRLARETLRTLSSADLTRVVSGCDTGSITTEHTDSFSAGCPRSMTCQ